MKKRFCPECGQSDKPFIQNLCVDCFLKKNPVLDYPKETKVLFCRDCGKVLRSGKWVPQSQDHLIELAKSHMKSKQLSNVDIDIGVEPMGNGSSMVSGHVHGKLGNEDISIPVEMTFKPSESLCRECSLLRADYYEAKVQLRFASKDKGEWNRIVEEIENRMDSLFVNNSLAKIARKELVSNGVDLWVGSKQATKTVVDELSKKYHLKPVHSFTLAGVDKSGRTKKTFTFLLRFDSV